MTRASPNVQKCIRRAGRDEAWEQASFGMADTRCWTEPLRGAGRSRLQGKVSDPAVAAQSRQGVCPGGRTRLGWRAGMRAGYLRGRTGARSGSRGAGSRSHARSGLGARKGPVAGARRLRRRGQSFGRGRRARAHEESRGAGLAGSTRTSSRCGEPQCGHFLCGSGCGPPIVPAVGSGGLAGEGA